MRSICSMFYCASSDRFIQVLDGFSFKWAHVLLESVSTDFFMDTYSRHSRGTDLLNNVPLPSGR